MYFFQGCLNFECGGRKIFREISFEQCVLRMNILKAYICSVEVDLNCALDGMTSFDDLFLVSTTLLYNRV